MFLFLDEVGVEGLLWSEVDDGLRRDCFVFDHGGDCYGQKLASGLGFDSVVLQMSRIEMRYEGEAMIKVVGLVFNVSVCSWRWRIYLSVL